MYPQVSYIITNINRLKVVQGKGAHVRVLVSLFNRHDMVRICCRCIFSLQKLRFKRFHYSHGVLLVTITARILINLYTEKTPLVNYALTFLNVGAILQKIRSVFQEYRKIFVQIICHWLITQLHFEMFTQPIKMKAVLSVQDVMNNICYWSVYA